MRIIDENEIISKLESEIIKCCYCVPVDVVNKLELIRQEEESPLAKEILKIIIENDIYASRNDLPTCQDTGILVCFVKVGYDVHIKGDLYNAINTAVSNAYVNGYLRKSVVMHPLNRVNTNNNTPAIIHVELVKGDKIIIDIAPKGGGSENMSAVKMLVPTEGEKGVKNFVIDTVKNAGGKPCPPIIVGVGIGGDFEKSALLSKQALLRDINDESEDETYRRLEKELCDEINNLGIGAMGFGGTKTCLAVKINGFACHIASLPVSVNIQCHCARHAHIEI